MKKLLFIFAFFIQPAIYAQHDEHMHMHPAGNDTALMPPMSHSFSLHLPMTRNGSGTAWLPDSTPMFGYMVHTKKWMFMFHGNVFVRYTKSDIFNTGTRGSEKVDAINWFMGMGQRRIGKRGLLRFSTMLSFDNLFGGSGYPLLFQTGETWEGKPLVDRQHPHDLFSELSLGYTYAINRNTDLFVYAGYPGEPALGSVAFMHRVSSLYGPDAPLSHHWNDGTHITFGVLTGGIRYRNFKLDFSNFTGKEPNENRYDFDRPKFDSYSGRLTYNPNSYWSFQVSEGFLKSPEAVNPAENIYRTTASVIYSKPLHRNSFINTTALWGCNRSHGNENAFLLESAFIIRKWSVFGRYEFVQKSAHELALENAAFDHETLFGINAFSLGVNYDLLQKLPFHVSIGSQVSYYIADNRLNYIYGENPFSGQVYIRIYPSRMNL